MHQRNPTRRFKFLSALAAVWFFVTGLLILLLWPDLPKTDLGWFVLIVVGPPIYVAGERFFDWLFSQKYGKKISEKKFSWLRIALVFVVLAITLGLSIFVSSIIVDC